MPVADKRRSRNAPVLMKHFLNEYAGENSHCNTRRKSIAEPVKKSEHAECEDKKGDWNKKAIALFACAGKAVEETNEFKKRDIKKIPARSFKNIIFGKEFRVLAFDKKKLTI